MGWTKTLTNIGNQGIDASYWKIDNISVVKDENWMTVKFAGYGDKAGKDAGQDPRAYAHINFKGNDFPLGVSDQQVAGEDIYKLVYDKMAEGSDTGTVKVIRHGYFDLSDATVE